MKKFKYIIIVCLILSIIAVCFTFFYKSKVVLVEGKIFTNRKIFFDSVDNKTNLIGIDDKYRICFYLDTSQNESIERLKGIKNIMNIYNENEFDYVLIWENEIPWNTLKDIGLNESQNLSLKGKVKLTNTKPSSFIINEDNEVEVIAEPSYLNLTRKIYELSSNKEEFVKKANEMIMKNINNKFSDEIDIEKDMLLIFTSTSCKRCTEVDDLISDNLIFMNNKFNVIDIKPDFDEGKAYSNITETDYHLTYFRTYAASYDLTYLPLFVIMDSNLQVKYYFNDAEEFVTYIRKINFM